MSKTLTALEAATELHALINSRVSNPRLEEIAAIIARVEAPRETMNSEPAQVSLARIRDAISRLDAAERLCLDTDDADARSQYDEREAEMHTLEAQIPNPPHSFGLARAEIAYFGADKERDERTMVPHLDDCFEGPAVRLIEAVLHFGDRRHG